MHRVININIPIPMCFPWSIKLKKISSLFLFLMWFKSYSRNPFQAAAILDIAAILAPKVTCSGPLAKSIQHDLSYICAKFGAFRWICAKKCLRPPTMYLSLKYLLSAWQWVKQNRFTKRCSQCYQLLANVMLTERWLHNLSYLIVR